jgi:hypothetical protein
MTAHDRPRAVAALWPPIAYMALIWVLSSLHGASAGGGAQWTLEWPALQNALHVPLFGLLAWLWLSGLARLRLGPIAGTAISASVSTAWAVIDEWHQRFVPGRYASVGDVLLDVIGIAGAIVLWYLLSRRRRRAAHSPN